MQKLLRGPAGQKLDSIEIRLADGSSMQLFFDIGMFFSAFDVIDSEDDEDDDEGGITIGDIMRMKDSSR